MSRAAIAAVVGGVLHDADHVDPREAVRGAAFVDSRVPVPDGLFVALPGEHADGHDHAAAAVAGGAAVVLGARPTGVPTIVVPDVLMALQTLAGHVLAQVRRTGRASVVGITGSQGKTTVKDIVAAVLASDARTVATHGSFNNELGLPLTVLRVDADTRYLVLEMGARGIGHIAELCRIAPPDVAVVLNVGTAHLGEFGDRAAIATAKGELVEALGEAGVAVLNADDPAVLAMADRTHARVMTFGTAPSADVRIDDVELDGFDRPAFRLHHGSNRADRQVRVRLGLVGRHQVGNAAAAATVALAVGMPLDRIATALTGLSGLTAASPWRMELRERADGMVVLNDAYNANPESMRAALTTLAAIGHRQGRRTIAVLGEMRELGAEAEDVHADIGAEAAVLGIDVVVAVGEGGASYARDRETTVLVGSVHEAAQWVRDNGDRADIVLVKASRAVGLEEVATALLTTMEEDER